jgi:hypothetical protein
MSSNLMEDKKGKAWRLKCLLKTSPIQGRITLLISDTELTAMPDNFGPAILQPLYSDLKWVTGSKLINASNFY